MRLLFGKVISTLMFSNNSTLALNCMSQLRIRLSGNSYSIALWEEVHLLITQCDWQTTSRVLSLPSLARLPVIRAILDQMLCNYAVLKHVLRTCFNLNKPIP